MQRCRAAGRLVARQSSSLKCKAMLILASMRMIIRNSEPTLHPSLFLLEQTRVIEEMRLAIAKFFQNRVRVVELSDIDSTVRRCKFEALRFLDGPCAGKGRCNHRLLLVNQLRVHEHVYCCSVRDEDRCSFVRSYDWLPRIHETTTRSETRALQQQRERRMPLRRKFVCTVFRPARTFRQNMSVCRKIEGEDWM